jgi:catechol 2,3-dioxygenase-like lactoylglutathione lyase family enzyme
MNLIKLIGGDENSFIGRVRMEVEKREKTKTGFTPVATSSHIVRDGEAAIAFYRDVLGMSVAMDLELSSPDSNVMLGRPKAGTTRSAFLEGSNLFGKIIVSHPLNYELPGSVAAAVAPNIGYLAQSFVVANIEEALEKSIKLGATLFSSATKLDVPGLGAREALIIGCPGSGALIELVSIS